MPQPAHNQITASRIRALRVRMNLTQPQLAKWIGVSQQTLADWEKGRVPKYAGPVVRLANILTL